MSVTYYFTGDCSEESVKDEIRQKFITTLSTSSYKDACLVYAKECNVDNVQVCTLVFVCLFVCLIGVYRPTREVFTHTETSHFDLCSAFMAIEQ